MNFDQVTVDRYFEVQELLHKERSFRDSLNLHRKSDQTRFEISSKTVMKHLTELKQLETKLKS